MTTLCRRNGTRQEGRLESVDIMTTSTLTQPSETDQGTSIVATMQDLRDRVEALEVSNSFTSTNTEVLLEFLKIIASIPAGRQVFNRALNRQKLNRLKEVVLPRRRSQLIEIMAERMPDPIREDFVSEEMKLLRQATSNELLSMCEAS
jgi:hypothetical protein